jgi:hypothetical protein
MGRQCVIVGGSAARDVRVETLGDVAWIKPKHDRVVLETGMLGVGGRIALVHSIPNQGETYQPVDLRLVWSSPIQTHSEVVRLDVGSHIAMRMA